jgi:hypothetical protein
MLGHSRISITLDLYSHMTDTMQRQAAAILDKLLGGQFGGQSPAEDNGKDGTA